MSYIFIEFELVDRHSIKTRNYCLDTYTLEIYNYISQNPEIRYKGCFTIKIIKISKIEELEIYQKIFNFTGQNFCSVKDYNISSIINNIYLEIQTKKIINHIFDKYLKINSKLEIYRAQYLDTHNWTKISNEFRKFLTDWNYYLDYQPYLLKFTPINYWDHNINDLIDQYTNPNPHIKDIGIFILDQNLKESDNFSRQDVMDALDIDQNLLIGRDPTVDKYQKVYELHKAILKFMNLYNADVLFWVYE